MAIAPYHVSHGDHLGIILRIPLCSSHLHMRAGSIQFKTFISIANFISTGLFILWFKMN